MHMCLEHSPQALLGSFVAVIQAIKKAEIQLNHLHQCDSRQAWLLRFYQRIEEPYIQQPWSNHVIVQP